MGKTLLIIKPDAIERGLFGEIISRLEKKGFRIIKGRFDVIEKETALAHYAEHADKPFYSELTNFITRGPSFVAVIESVGQTWKMLRNLMGETDPQKALPGTIRGDLATDIGENLVHGSDSEESAEREIKLFFPDVQI